MAMTLTQLWRRKTIHPRICRSRPELRSGLAETMLKPLAKMGSRLNLQRNFRSGAVIAALGAALAFGTPAPAQTTQGQFTPDASAPIQLHMPVRLHMPAQHRAPAKKKIARQKVPATSSSPAEAAAIPFGPAAP